MKKLILFFMVSLLFISCGHHRDGTSVWSGGLWIIPVLCLVGLIAFGYQAVRSSKSNSTQQTRFGTKDNTGNVPIYKLGYFWMAVGCLLGLIAVIILVNGDK